MTISKRIIIGYGVFFVIYLTVGIYSVIKNFVSLDYADTLDTYNKVDVIVNEASEHFLDARAESREMAVTKTYSDDVYNAILKDLDESLEHMEEFSDVAKGRNLGNLTNITGEIVTGLQNYRSMVVSKYELDRKRITVQNDFFTLGLNLRDSFETALMTLSVAVADEALYNSDLPISDQIMQSMDIMHRLNMVVYEFTDVRIAIRNVMFLDAISSYDSIKETLNKITDDLNSYKGDVSNVPGIDYDKLLSDLNLYEQYAAKYKSLTETGTALSNDMNNEYKNIQEKVKNVNTITLDNLNGIISDILDSSNKGVFYTIVIALTTLVINVVLSVLIRKSINADLTKSMRDMAETSSGIQSASHQMTAASERLSQGNDEQVAAIEETSSAMNQTSAMINNSSENTERAAQLSEITSNVSEDGVRQIDNMINFMRTLNESSDKISKIISNINTIASQTTILALNASIEAVRAGETGKSFSVVAEEVKNLAQQITEAAKTTAIIIEENVNLTRQGTDISKGVGETLETICGDAKKVSELLKEILAMSTEQVQGAEQINKAMSQIEKVTQLNSAVSEESASTADELQNRSNKLQEIMRNVQHLIGV